MSADTTTTWTCRRCGAVEVVEGRGQPPNWVRAYFASPPCSAEHRRIEDLCDPCGGYLVSFVHGTEAEDMARDAETDRILAQIQAEVDDRHADLVWRGEV